MSAPQTAGTDRPSRLNIFKKARGGVPLTREEIKEIKAGRKKLRKDMRAAGIKSKDEFELTASSLGLYFDKRNGLLLWLFHGKGLWMLLGTLLLALLALLGMAWVSQMRGLFTINMDDDLFREGFVLSETADFAHTAHNLFSEPAADIPCISIASLHTDIDDYEGQHNGPGYFAYTYFLRNDGESVVDYRWEMKITGESLEASTAAWVAIIEDGALALYAEAAADGTPETVPPASVSDRGYLEIPVLDLAPDPGVYLQPMHTTGRVTYYRLTPTPFADPLTVATGYQSEVVPGDVHKYTVVVWFEGDDPDCTDALIGSHLGLGMQYTLVERETPAE